MSKKQFGYIYLNHGGDLYSGPERFDTKEELEEFIETDENFQDLKLYIIEGEDLKFYDRT